MAVPNDPSVDFIVTQGLKRAGRTQPTVAQIAEAREHALQDVKADIMQVAGTHPSLLATATTVTTRGLQRYAFPDDYNEPYSIMLLDGPEEWKGTAQGGGGRTIILDATLTVDAADLVGRYIIITGGPGVEEYRQIVSYNSGTKVAQVEANWSVVPTSASTYTIVNVHKQLLPALTNTQLDRIPNPSVLGTPDLAAEFGQEYLLYPVPDKSTYGILNRYFVDLSKLDEEGDLFVQLLREWSSLWKQGVAVKTMERFDEDRYQTALNVYQAMLTALGDKTCRVLESTYRDV